MGSVPRCQGTARDHCCWVDGEVCRFLVIDGDTIACGLRLRLGSWAAVHADAGYLAHVRPTWDEIGMADCGDWQPPPGEACGACGILGERR